MVCNAMHHIWIEHGRQWHVEAERITRKIELAATATG
jgi:hypothetical protein